MSGALVDLVAKGVQDAYLSGNPEISFFRQKYSRHTNFSIKPAQLNYIGTASDSNEISIKVPNKGDLLTGVWLDIDQNTIDTDFLGVYTNNPTVFELYIGGQLVDRQDAAFTGIVAQSHLLNTYSKIALSIHTTGVHPLQFFHCNGCAALPLVALQYHEVEIKIKFSPNATGINNLKVYGEYILLDTQEREWFVNNEHSLLIEQVQKIPPVVDAPPSSLVWDLSLLNHPVKSLHTANTFVSQTGTAMLYLNGTQLFDTPMPSNFFKYVQPYYHTSFDGSLAFSNNTKPMMYSFALDASKHVPCGSCNFSRLDNAELKVSGSGYDQNDNKNLYAVNWNILRIKKGLAGLAFSN